MKTTILVLCLIMFSMNSLAYTLPVINATFTNTTATNFTCSVKMNNTAGENTSTSLYISSNLRGSLNYSSPSYTQCKTNASINLSSNILINTSPCEILFCAGESLLCNYENGSLSVATMTITGPNCTTTTTTPTTVTIGVIYEPLWGLNDSENTTGLSNTSAIGSTILGLSKANFFKLTSIILVILVILGISKISVKTGVVSGFAVMDFLILVVKWIDIPISLFLLINVTAVLIFVAGGRR